MGDNMTEKYFLHLSNGDFNEKQESLQELLSDIDFEIQAGSQNYLIITKRLIKTDQYARICKILEE